MTLSADHARLYRPSREQAALIRAELTAILASENFSSSRRCQDFLAFIVEKALAGDYESLTERFLGVHLFGRPVDYETATDSIVRVRANDVRKRLSQYHTGTRSISPIRIELTAGGYVPEFQLVTEESNQIAGTSDSPQSAGSPFPAGVSSQIANVSASVRDGVELPTEVRVGVTGSHDSPRGWLWIGGAIATLALVFFALIPHSRQTNFDRFWEPVLATPSSPVISLPTTDTFVISSGSPEILNRMKSGDAVTLKSEDVLTYHNWHESMPVIQATLSVAFALKRKDKIPLVRMGTDLRQDELLGHPVIAIGSFSNPWTQQNISGLRFTFDRGASDREPPRIRDAFNPQRSWSLAHTYPKPQTKDYAIITRTFDPQTHEPFISLAGLHSFGNQVAGEFVSQDSSWDAIAARAPSGWEKMNLQIVIETNIIDTTPSSPTIVDVHFWK